MENILKVLGVILLLVFASVSLAIRLKLTKYQERIKRDGEEQRSDIAKTIRNTLGLK